MSYYLSQSSEGPLKQQIVKLSETIVKCRNNNVANRTAAMASGVSRYRSGGFFARRAVADNDDRRSARFLSGEKFSVVDVRISSLIGCKKLQHKVTSR